MPRGAGWDTAPRGAGWDTRKDSLWSILSCVSVVKVEIASLSPQRPQCKVTKVDSQGLKQAPYDLPCRLGAGLADPMWTWLWEALSAAGQPPLSPDGQ